MTHPAQLILCLAHLLIIPNGFQEKDKARPDPHHLAQGRGYLRGEAGRALPVYGGRDRRFGCVYWLQPYCHRRELQGRRWQGCEHLRRGK